MESRSLLDGVNWSIYFKSITCNLTSRIFRGFVTFQLVYLDRYPTFPFR